jgi:hypothetical protein
MRQAYVQKSFPIATFATFVRHSISKLSDNYYSLPTGIIAEQIAIGKVFCIYACHQTQFPG